MPIGYVAGTPVGGNVEKFEAEIVRRAGVLFSFFFLFASAAMCVFFLTFQPRTSGHPVVK